MIAIVNIFFHICLFRSKHNMKQCPVNSGLRSAAEIAVETVRRYKVETGSKIKVVFNVFKDLDKTIYERLLGANCAPAARA